MGLRGFVLGVAVLAGAIVASGVSTASAMPDNDVTANVAKMFVPDPDLTGVRRKAERVNGTVIDPDTLAAPAVDTGDPPLIQPPPSGGLQPSSTCFAGSQVLGDPTNPAWFAQRTVWYEVTQDATGAPFGQSTLVTIDTGGSNFPSGLAVFLDGMPAFDSAAPVLPMNTLACDRNPSANIPSVVSFVARLGHRYFLMAGGLPPVAGSPALRLSMRILDVQAPVVSIELPDRPDVKRVFEYQVASADKAAVASRLEITQTAGSKSTTLRKAALGAHCGDSNRPAAGQFCVIGSTVRVHWNPITSSAAVVGTVLAEFTDRAGNVGSNNLKTPLRDRIPPKLSANTTARWTRRGRLFVITTCTGGPGTISVQYGAGKKSAGPTTDFGRHTVMQMKKVFPKVTRRSTFIHIICKDRSSNATDTWLFLPAR